MSIVDIVVVDIVEVIYRIELDKLVYLYLVCFSGKKKRKYLDVSYKKIRNLKFMLEKSNVYLV